ncbi:MAG TPA: extracellular solute-binding protein [Myxococcales bacterium]|nr:extracellular solute-binding protein [Myxococcales bacterium]
MNRMLLALALVLSCKPSGAPGEPAEVQLSTDLNPGMADTALALIARNGGPRAARVAGMQAGASALVDGGAAAAAAGDVRWDSEPYGAIAAAGAGELMPAPESAKDVPPLWKDPGGTWVAVGGRAEVLLVAVEALGDHPVPVRYTALTEPWLKGKVALPAPTGGMALAHFAALYQAWGAERMEAWLKQLAGNEPQVYPDDDGVRQAVVSGQAVVGIVSSDEAAKAAASAARVQMVYPNQKSIGVFVWPTALSVPKSAKNPEAAQKLAAMIADRSTEQLLVARVPGYLPLRAGIPVPPGVRSASNLVVVSVDPARIVSEISARKAALAAWTASLPKPPAPTAERK